MSIEFYIPGEFTTLNQYNAAARSPHNGAGRAAQIKRDETRRARAACDGVKVPADWFPVRVHFIWYRRDARTDLDNLDFARKCILDGMIPCKEEHFAGVIPDDSLTYVTGLSCDFGGVEKDNPGVTVIISPDRRQSDK